MRGLGLSCIALVYSHSTAFGKGISSVLNIKGFPFGSLKDALLSISTDPREGANPYCF